MKIAPFTKTKNCLSLVTAFLITAAICAGFAGCGTSAQTTAYQTISALNVGQQTLWTAYVSYRSTTPVSSGTDSNVVAVFNTLKTDELAAIDTVTNGGSFNTNLLSEDLTAIISTLQTAGVKSLPTISTNL